MANYIIRRLLLFIPMLAGLSILTDSWNPSYILLRR